jgi:hypothetical protein
MIAARSLFTLALALAAAPAWAQSMLPGEWRISIGSPAMPGASSATATQCIARSQADDGPAVIARRVRPRADCTTTSAPAGYGEYAWTFDCPQSHMHGEGRLRYRSTELEGQIRSSSSIGGANVDMTQKLSARRIGPCAK